MGAASGAGIVEWRYWPLHYPLINDESEDFCSAVLL